MPRMCIVCRERFEKSELIRICKNTDGSVFVDSDGKAQTRGAYVCKSQKCIDDIRRRKAIERTFGVQLSDEVLMRIKKEAKL